MRAGSNCTIFRPRLISSYSGRFRRSRSDNITSSSSCFSVVLI
uniref:Protein binding protein, putative n=1 Tax=Arundo donax TaxID=35708 RepID=A0A0A9F9D8_ARUDO